MRLLIAIAAGYFIGSIPFALVIGKVFYHTDVRQHGSGNLGGSNTGRVLGKRAGLATMALDLLKVTFVMLLVRIIGGDAGTAAVGALAAGIGHCFPIYAGFKGGKAVASMYGFLIGLVFVYGRTPLYFFVPIAFFAVILFLGRMTSLASMISSVVAAVFICIHPELFLVKLVQAVYTFMIVYRHRSNIERIRNHNENKVTWIPKF